MVIDVAGSSRLVVEQPASVTLNLFNRLFAHIAAVATRHGGYVNGVIGDTAVLLFGAPDAHSDGPGAAVRAARDLLHALAGINAECARECGVDPDFRLRIGVATGDAAVGWIGAPNNRTFTVIGPPMGLSTALCRYASPMDVVVCGTTAAAFGTALRAREFTATGSDTPISAYRVSLDPPRTDAAWPRSPFIGRVEALRDLRRVVAALRHKRGSTVTLTGKAGIGKTRLVEEALSACAVPIDIAQASRFDTTSPLSLFIPPVSRWLRALPSPLQEKLSGVHWLRDLASGNYGTRPVLDAQRFRTSALDALTELIGAVMRGRPRILIIDNAQWADATSRLAIAALSRLTQEQPLLLIVIGRTALGLDLRGDHELKLTPMPLEDATALVQAAAALSGPGIEGMSAVEARELATRSGGTPLFAEEFARYAASTASDPARAPKLRAILAERHAQKPPQTQLRLELASVFMRFFEPAVVDQMAGLPHDPDAWETLEAAGEVVVEQAGASTNQYRLRHSMAQEVLYEALTPRRREELHGHISDLLLESNEMVPRHALAWHLERAGRSAEASAAWLEAAEQAVCMFANIEALNLYERALSLADTGATRTRCVVAQARLLARLGRLSEAATLLEQAGEAAEAAGDLVSKSQAYAERAEVAYRAGDGEGIGTFADIALRAARDGGDRSLVASALRQVGLAHEFAGRFGPAERAYREVLAQERELMTSAYLVDVYNSLGEIARHSGRPDVALMWYDKSQRVFERTQPGAVNALGMANRGAALVALRRYDEAAPLLDASIAEKERTGYRSFMAEPLSYRAWTAAVAGAHEEARVLLTRALAMAREHGEQDMLALSTWVLAHLLEMGLTPLLDEPRDAVSAFEEAARLFQLCGGRIMWAHCLMDLAACLQRCGEPDRGIAPLEHAIHHFQALDQTILATAAAEALAQLRAKSSGLVAGSK